MKNADKSIWLPSVEDWCLLLEPEDRPALADKLNRILLDVLDSCRKGKLRCTGEIQVAVYSKIDELHATYPTAGLKDSETNIAIAQFFSVNHDENLYDAMRFPILDH